MNNVTIFANMPGDHICSGKCKSIGYPRTFWSQKLKYTNYRRSLQKLVELSDIIKKQL